MCCCATRENGTRYFSSFPSALSTNELEVVFFLRCTDFALSNTPCMPLSVSVILVAIAMTPVLPHSLPPGRHCRGDNASLNNFSSLQLLCLTKTRYSSSKSIVLECAPINFHWYLVEEAQVSSFDIAEWLCTCVFLWKVAWKEGQTRGKQSEIFYCTDDNNEEEVTTIWWSSALSFYILWLCHFILLHS